MDDLHKIRETFFAEAHDIIENLDSSLLELENNSSDQDLLNAAFRSFHTLKGSCGILGFKVMENFTHHLEDLLDYLRTNNIPPSREVMDILFDGLDLIKLMVATYMKDEVVDPSMGINIEAQISGMLPSKAAHESAGEVISKSGLDIDFMRSLPDEALNKAAASVQDGERLYYISIKLDESCFTLGIDPLPILKNLAANGEIIFSSADAENVPSLDKIDPHILYLRDIALLFSSSMDSEKVEDVFEFAHMAGDISIHQLSASEIEKFVTIESDDAFWKDVEAEEAAGERPVKLGEILVGMGEVRQEDIDDALDSQGKPLGTILVEKGVIDPDAVENALDLQKSQGIAPRASIKVDTEKLDNLVNLVGELVISQAMVSHNETIMGLDDNNLKKILSQLNKITRDIQAHAMSMRMIPIKDTFQKMMRVARDVSRKAGKEIELKISGEETELDKTVIDEIGDPLLHILRNAIDHGIEPPEERIKRGKDSKGKVMLRAFHQGGNIVIEVNDDGRGLDKDKIFDKALERGLVSQVSDLSDEQIYNILFEPGFSTAEKVTDVSGRGVGMDVVKRNIDKLRGKIDIQTVFGQGSTFSLRLPLTLAIIDGMIVEASSQRYIIPTISIIEFLKPTSEQVHTVKGRGEMVMIREELFPLIRLHAIFNLKPVHENVWDSLVVLVEGAGRRSCLLVDDLFGQQQVVIKTLGDKFKKSQYVSGGAIMGDGQVGLILDTAGICEATLGQMHN